MSAPPLHVRCTLLSATLVACSPIGQSCKSSPAPTPPRASPIPQTDSGLRDATSAPDAMSALDATTDPDAMGAAPPPPPGEDGSGVYPPVPRIIAIGDVHGDGAATMKVLRGTGVIDANENWAAGTSWVVQVGDQLDNRNIQRLRHLYRG